MDHSLTGVCLHHQSDQLANLEFNNALPSGDMIEMDDLPAACAFEKFKGDPRRDRLGARKGVTIATARRSRSFRR